MFVISLIVFVLCVAVMGGLLWFLANAIHGAGVRRLVSGARGVLSGVPDGTGISALCSDTWSFEQLENLLAVEYPRYEIVVVLDAQRRKEAFAAILERYQMIRVTYIGNAELPVEGVRGLYRSKRRCFRRMVVVDKAYTTSEADFDAAVGVATYEYLLPVREGQMLVQGAVDRLVIELSRQPHGELEMIRTIGGVPGVLYTRCRVTRRGGFGMHPERGIPRRRRRTLYEALFSLPLRERRRGVHFAAGAMLIVSGGMALALGWWLLLAVVLTVMLVWIALAYAAPLVGGIAHFRWNFLWKYITG